MSTIVRRRDLGRADLKRYGLSAKEEVAANIQCTRDYEDALHNLAFVRQTWSIQKQKKKKK
jgi:hypothetical protein